MTVIQRGGIGFMLTVILVCTHFPMDSLLLLLFLVGALMLVVGKKDTLVPLSVTNEFENMFSNCEKLILEKTGHAPFISNPEVCAEKIKNFINE